MRRKIGIYVRVSTEEQAQVVEGSIASQKHRLASFVDIKNLQEPGWGIIVDTYADEGLSAKDTRRPAFQRMMSDVRKGRINLILVADLSRLSRNILDFCILLDDLKKYSAKFLSIKEQFDTTTPVGELMVFHMISLGQFERKQTAERVSLNFHSRALRGLRNGGPAILGYEKDPSTSSYLVNESEAKSVNEIFQMYLEEGTIANTLKRLRAEKILRKVGNRKSDRLSQSQTWSRPALNHLLRNQAYIGKRQINQQYKNHDQDELKGFQKYQVVRASWPGIVPEDLFNDVQKSLDASLAHERVRLSCAERRVFFLSGILRCPECGAPYVGEAGHGRRETYRYYVHKRYVGKKMTCLVKRFSANTVEEKVVEHMNTFLQEQGYLLGVEQNIKAGFNSKHAETAVALRRVAGRLAEVEKEIMGVFRLQASMDDGPGVELAKEQLNDLATKKSELKILKAEKEAQLALSEENGRLNDATKSKILAFPTLWRKGKPAEQKRLLRTIFQFLQPTAGSLQVFYWLADSEISGGPTAGSSGTAQNDKRDVDSKSASLHLLRPVPNVLPTVQIPAIVKNGVKDGT
jgi:site-specific DNA recombinase